MNSRRMSPCLYETVEFFDKIAFQSLDTPLFEMKSKIWIFALPFLKSAHSRALTGAPKTSKRPKTAIFGIFA